MTYYIKININSTKYSFTIYFKHLLFLHFAKFLPATIEKLNITEYNLLSFTFITLEVYIQW